MFVLTVDQVDSRHTGDLVARVEADRAAYRAGGAELGPDRTAGDEFQVLFRAAGPALRVALDLLRTGSWSVGLGAGDVAEPLPATTREATGPAFTDARSALDAAKRSPVRFAAVRGDRPEQSADVTALVRLLLELRSRRSPEGWEVADLTTAGLSQSRIAERLGVTAQAVSLRARVAGLRTELEVLPAIERALARLDQR